jgi:hypothetical protein
MTIARAVVPYIVRRGSHVERDAVLAILRETRARLARPDNNFDWSGWEDGEAALNEIDSLIASIRTGALADPTQVAWLFAPTGPIQEVSASSGWGDVCLELAKRIEAATR